MNVSRLSLAAFWRNENGDRWTWVWMFEMTLSARPPSRLSRRSVLAYCRPPRLVCTFMMPSE